MSLDSFFTIMQSEMENRDGGHYKSRADDGTAGRRLSVLPLCPSGRPFTLLNFAHHKLATLTESHGNLIADAATENAFV